MRDEYAQTLSVGIHFVLLGLLTWGISKPLLFPSLGPSSYLLAAGKGEDEEASSPYHVIGGHLIAVVAGLVSYHVLAGGLVITDVVLASAPVSSMALLRLGASSVVGMMLTTLGMLVSETNHPAACATTLVVSLGVISTFVGTIYIMLAVIFLVGANYFVIYPLSERFGFEPENPR